MRAFLRIWGIILAVIGVACAVIGLLAGPMTLAITQIGKPWGIVIAVVYSLFYWSVFMAVVIWADDR